MSNCILVFVNKILNENSNIINKEYYKSKNFFRSKTESYDKLYNNSKEFIDKIQKLENLLVQREQQITMLQVKHYFSQQLYIMLIKAEPNFVKNYSKYCVYLCTHGLFTLLMFLTSC